MNRLQNRAHNDRTLKRSCGKRIYTQRSYNRAKSVYIHKDRTHKYRTHKDRIKRSYIKDRIKRIVITLEIFKILHRRSYNLK